MFYNTCFSFVFMWYLYLQFGCIWPHEEYFFFVCSDQTKKKITIGLKILDSADCIFWITEKYLNGSRTIDRKTTDRMRNLRQLIGNWIIQVAYWPIWFKRSFIIQHVTCSVVIFCSVVIDSVTFNYADVILCRL